MPNDPFRDASSGFVNALTYIGRLLLITPTGVETGIKSTMANAKEGDTYDRVICDIVVLDGEITDDFDVIPCKVEGQILSGSGLMPQLTRRTGGGNVAPGGMTLGRMASRAGKMSPKGSLSHSLTTQINNGFWSLDPPTEEDKQKARNYLNELDPFAAPAG